MSFLKAIEAGAIFCALCGIGCWALSKWSRTTDPSEEEDRPKFKPMKAVKQELDDFEEALGGEDLKVADSQRN